MEIGMDSDNALIQAAVATVAFFDVFDYPLTLEEISNRMIGALAPPDRLRGVLAAAHGVAAGASPPPVPLIVLCDGFYVLPGREHLAALRAAGQAHHNRLLTRVRRAARLFSLVPFVRSVFLCNRLAMAQADATSDIDVLVVVRRGHLFFVRAVLLGIFHLFGLRRHGARVAGRFCFSFMIDDAHLDLSTYARDDDVYFAAWTLLLQPIYDARGGGSHDARHDMLRANSWIQSFFPHLEKRLAHETHELRAPREAHELSPTVGRFAGLLRGTTAPIRYFLAAIGHVAEPCMRAWQLRRARAKYEALGRPHGVVVERWCLKFHDRDMRDAYRDAWRQRLRNA